jgi:hypothetical protein
MVKNVRIRAWREEEATGTALAWASAARTSQKVYLVGLSTYMPRRIADNHRFFYFL